MEVIKLFKHLLSKESVTPSDGGLLDFIEEYLDGFEAIRIDVGDVKNLLLYKKFKEGKHLSFAGHVDVVPAGDGWDTNPYEAVEKDGFIYGRGTQDMKSGLAAFLSALKNAKDFNGTLSALITSDEEGDAIWGTKYMLEILKEKNLIPNYAIVAEPTSEERFGDAIKIGRRGSINGYLTLKGLHGHAAYPEKSINPIHKVAQVLHKIAGVNLDEGDEFFAPSKFVITDIRAGMEVTNVTPGELKMMFNVRNNTHTNLEDIKKFIHKYFKDMNYKLTLTQSAESFITNPDTKVVKTLDKAIKKHTGITPKHSTAGGTSDARFFAKYGVKVVEFGVKNDTIHAPNERTTPEEVTKLADIFGEVIKQWQF